MTMEVLCQQPAGTDREEASALVSRADGDTLDPFILRRDKRWVFSQQRRPPRQATHAFVVQRMEGRFGIQLDSRRRFNAKFQPEWVPRYLVYRSRADLLAIGLAALSSEGFLPFDHDRLT